MKKILVFFLALLFALPATVHAESPMLKTEDDLFFKTYQPEEIALMSVVNYDELEQHLLDVWENLEAEIDVSDYRLTVEEFDDFYKKTLFAHPLYFYVLSGFSYYTEYGFFVGEYVSKVYIHYKHTYVETDENNIILPEADITQAKEKIFEKTNEIMAITDEFLFYINRDMTEFEKVMTVHDYIVKEYSYDWDFYYEVTENGGESDPSYYGFSLEMITEKTGVCQGYSLIFTHIMQQLSVETAFVSSAEMDHAWNLVKVDGEWYHIDLTWDDRDCCKTHAHHEYALLSSERIGSMDSPHKGFDTGDIKADSVLYDDAAWHSDMTPLAFCRGEEYWVDGDNLVKADGEIIYENLSGGNKWRIDSSDVAPNSIWVANVTYAGVVAYNHKIYFNTDTEIFCYNENGTITSVTGKSGLIPGIAGLRIDNNELVYDIIYLTEEKNTEIKEGGRITLENIRVMDSYIENGKLITKMYKKDLTPMKIYMFGDNEIQSKIINESGNLTIEFDASGERTLFFWDENLKPLRDKEVVSAN